MARGIEWDTYRPDASPRQPEQPQPASPAANRKTSAGPSIAECDECGQPANPCWGDNGLNYCRSCVRDDLLYPARKP